MLQYILNDEGRARPVIPDGGTGQTKFVYDYFLKDHLGNVRSVVTAEPVSPKYLAKHEIASANIENLFFDNIPAVRGDKPGSTNPEDTKAALLNASDPNRIIGTTLMLRVMPGDKFTISADAYFDGNDNGKGDHLPAEEIINQLFGTLLQGANYENIPLKELPDNVRTIKEVLGGRGLPEAINDMLNATDDPTLPRAHLNYLVFDDKMNLDTKVSGAVQVPMGGGSWGTLDPGHQIGILTPGYILIYVDNQSIGKDVWFDNIHVEHYTGKVLEQNHYYPFGLTIAQDGAATSTEQPYKYNGKELVKAFGLESYDYGARIFDPQIGRWKGVDPLGEKYPNQSPYLFCNGNPILYMDPDGRDGIITIKGGQITISSNIYLYGAGATKAVSAQYQSDINSMWGGTFSAKTSDGKQSFNVNVSVNVGLYKGKEKSDPWIIPGAWNPNNRDNFVEVGAGDKRSYVSGGDEGEWRSQGRNDKTLAQDDPAPHELGHLLGLDDRYTDKDGPNKGWENNIMADSQNGKVEQRNIDGILQDAMKAYETWSKDKNNAGKEFKYEIDINRPNKENQNE